MPEATDAVFTEGLVQKLGAKYGSCSKYAQPVVAKLVLDPHLAYERQAIERHFRFLPDRAKLDVGGRLRSENPAQHFGAYYELVLNAHFRAFGYSIDFHATMPEGQPDFLLTREDMDSPIIVEVATVFDNADVRARELRMDSILDALSTVEHHFLLDIQDESPTAADDFDRKALRRFISQWMDTFDPYTMQGYPTTSYHDGSLQLGLTLYPKKAQERGPIIASWTLGVQAVDIGLVRDAIERKIKKYKSAKEMKLPLVVAIASGGAFRDVDSLMMVMFGNLAVTVTQGPSGEPLAARAHRTNTGLVTPKPGLGGVARNTRLSGVIHVRSKWVTPDGADAQYAERGHQFTFVQNPFAAVPTHSHFMGSHPRLAVTSRSEDHFTLGWVNRENEYLFRW
ncbi:MAG: hypothetical protein KAX25_06165 [Dehalococcoidia bacterium]|nr:hypothetical protein [Dehalococcoidia bacterium]